MGITTRTSVPGSTAGGNEPPCQPAFVTTHWSVVLTVGRAETVQARAALETLCRAYWYPLYAHVRRRGYSPEDAQDLTQEFFARLLEKDYLQAAAREKGRFRTFLLVALKCFLANDWRRAHAQTRGGFATVVSIDHELAESRFAAEPGHQLQPDVQFDRQWAGTLLERTVSRLRQEYATTGRAVLFEHLQNCLAQEPSALPYAAVATRLDLTEAAVKVAMHRLRVRYREILREEIADTLATSGDVEEELRYLFSVFGP